MERVGAGPSVVQVRGWDPLGVAVLVFAGGPALFGEWVVGAAAERQVVGVGGVAFGVGRAVMDFGVIARDVASWVRAPAVFGKIAASAIRRSRSSCSAANASISVCSTPIAATQPSTWWT